jgi:tripartite-type tricarboxylate transporter receptor subunit TctC
MKARSILCMFVAVAVILFAGAVFGQDYPKKPIRIVASEAGSSNDLVARIIADGLSKRFNQTVMVENRGGGVVAGEIVSKSAPDGYTLLYFANGLWITPLMRDKMPYDTMKDFAPISWVITVPNVVVVHPSFPANSIKELIALAKAKPGAIKYASASAGTANHLAAELFKYMAHVDLDRIPYKGMAPALNATMSGETSVMFPSAGVTMAAYVKPGKLKALAVTTKKPSPLTPGLPTVAETVPGYESNVDHGVFAPAGTPVPIINLLNKEIARILNQDDVKKKLNNLGLDVVASSPEELRNLMKADVESMGKLIKAAGITDN